MCSHFESVKDRQVLKVQGFDNQTGEHVIRIEYRIKLVSEGAVGLIRSANDQLNRNTG